ncbi:aspartic proteinase nepenthesin-1-like [Phragmites australis]|uniref:aspartic proteinase nepenthesin-1-like n=1 Tax=Phragmites australis TaxID=29695 RepID=UPI002D790414|nr:aspartic proteinase nepenthesin-1-like [Phragmites australis]
MEAARLLLLVAVVVAASCTTGALAATPHLKGLRVHLTHVDAHGNYSRMQLLQRAARRSQHRMSRLVARATGVPIASSSKAVASGGDLQVPVHAGNGEFLMDLAIGTPALAYSAIVDTGSDLVWTQCKPCLDCFKQSTPVFDPSSSSTYATLPCSSSFCSDLPTSTCSSASKCGYTYTYGDASSTQGILATETFTLAKAKLPGVAFGCGDTNEGDGFTQGAGLVGLGRGPLSLVSQLGLEKFSYCLTSLDDTNKSPLLLGSVANISESAATAPVQTTPLVKNPSQPSFYYVTLTGITVGSTEITLPSSAFTIQDDGTGGVIVDSGTSITYLEVQGYRALKKAFAAQMSLPTADGSGIGLDLCFQAPAKGVDQVSVPKLVFHFDGGADLDLPAENYMVLDSGSGALCLTVMGSRGLSIIGNFQQQNFQFVYDVAGDKLSFAPVQCAKL